MLPPNEIKTLKAILSQTKTNKPFVEVASAYRQLTGKNLTPDQIAGALNEKVVEQSTRF